MPSQNDKSKAYYHQSFYLVSRCNSSCRLRLPLVSVTWGTCLAYQEQFASRARAPDFSASEQPSDCVRTPASSEETTHY